MGGMRFGRTSLVARAHGPGRIAIGRLWRSVGLLAVLLVGVLALVPAGASAEPLCTDTWTGPAEGEWTTAEDWSTGKVPTSTSVACIGEGKTVDVPSGTFQTGVLEGKGGVVLSGGRFSSLEVASALEASNIHSLNTGSGSLGIADQLEVTGSFSGSGGGTLSGSGTIVIGSGATGTVSSSSLSLVGATLKNVGTFTISGSGSISASSNGVFANSGTLYLSREGEDFEGAEGKLVNTGTVKKTEGSGTTIVGIVVENESSLTTTAGKLEFTRGAASQNHTAGSWTASGTGTGIVFNQGGSTFALGNTVKLEGTFEANNGTVSAGKFEAAAASITVNGAPYEREKGTLETTGSGVSEIKNLTLTTPYGFEGGELTGTGQVVVNSSFSAGGYSTLSGSGSVEIKSGATATITSGMYLTGGTLKNVGTLTISGSGYINGSGHGVLANSGTLYINREETGLTGEATLVNTGAVKKTEGSGTTKIGLLVENEGTITTTAGR